MSNRMDVKQGKHKPSLCCCLAALLLEIVGGRLCPVEQVMTRGEKKKQKTAAIGEMFSLFELVVTCGHGCEGFITMMAACVDAMLEE